MPFGDDSPYKTQIQWIGLSENLQETMDFSIKYFGVL